MPREEWLKQPENKRLAINAKALWRRYPSTPELNAAFEAVLNRGDALDYAGYLDYFSNRQRLGGS